MLYKYFPPDRRDVLENELVRFTQPGDFNDPFELLPSFDLMSKGDIAALPVAPGQNSIGSEAHVLTPEVAEAMLSAVLPGLQKQAALHAGQEGMFALDNNRIAQSTFDSKFGILCLTEIPDSLLMWAHYAKNHSGFVIQLDETHEFFSPSVHEGQTFELTKVEYSAQRPVLSYSTINSPIVYYRKSPEWSCEKEWRIIKPLSARAEVINHSEYPRYLFHMPSSAIKGVIIGCSMTDGDRAELIKLLSQPDLKHITIYQTVLSKDEYKLEIHPPLEGPYPPDALSGKVCEAR